MITYHEAQLWVALAATFGALIGFLIGGWYIVWASYEYHARAMRAIYEIEIVDK